jgi:hypothetical protein
MNKKTIEFSLLIFLIFAGFVVPAGAAEDLCASDTDWNLKKSSRFLKGVPLQIRIY